MNLRTAMIEAIAQEWEGNSRMNRVVDLAWHMAGKEPANDVRRYADLAAAVKAKHIEAMTTARIFVGRYLPKMGDALIDRRPRESCVAAGLRELGGKATATIRVSARAMDKRSDWGTCK